MPFRIVAVAPIVALTALLWCPAHAQFETRGTLFLGSIPYSVAVGDFDRDGVLDVAEVSFLPSGSVEILLGNGDGTFRAGATYAVGVQPFYATAASLTRNGILDLVVGDSLSDHVYVMLGNGDGTFQSPVAYPTGGRPVQVGTGNFTGSGNLDIVALTGNGTECDCVEVLPGNGDGTFGAAIDTPVPYDIQGFALAAGDFNNDGKVDVAVSGGFFSSNQVDILLGNGDGTFTPDGFYDVSASPGSMATGYFTTDKTKLDLVVANQEGSSLSILLGNGDGTFQPSVYYRTAFPTWVAARDLDGDGRLDLAVSNPGLGNEFLPGLSTLKGNGDGTFQHEMFFPVGTITGLTFVDAGDFNNDGRTDLLAVDEGAQITTLLNTGNATFSPTSPLTFSGQLLGTTSAVQTVTLTNSGTTAMTISGLKSSGAPFRMTATTCEGSLAPGAQCSITAEFTAQTKGAVNGTITLNDSTSSKPQFVELVGIGTELGMAPTKLSFPVQKVGTTSAPRTIHLTNVGKTAITFTHKIIILGGDGLTPEFFESNNCGSQLAPATSCALSVTFQPHRTGRRRAYLNIRDDGGDSPQNVPLNGKGN